MTGDAARCFSYSTHYSPAWPKFLGLAWPVAFQLWPGPGARPVFSRNFQARPVLWPS